MKIISIADQIAGALANEKTRELMKYRANFVHEEGVYKDYFSGAAYQNFKQNTCLFQGEDDVALGLFVDGFSASKSPKADHLTIVHLINFNIPPEYR